MLENTENNDVPLDMKIDTFDDFLKLAQEHLYNKDSDTIPSSIGVIHSVNSPSFMVYRGHKSTKYKLESSFERKLNKACFDNISDEKYEELKNKYFLECKSLLKGKLPEQQMLLADDKYEDEIWAFCQHYGIETPLLDWSHSFFTAVYFAFEDKDSETDYRAVYSLYTRTLFGGEMDNIIARTKTDLGGRLTAQRGVFTKERCKNLISMNEEYRKNNVCKHINYEGTMIYKIYISSTLRTEIMRFLYTIGVTPLTIYPDIKGVAKACEIELDNVIAYESLPD